MALKGPIVTLLAGALLAGVLAAANVNAVNRNTRPYQGAPSPAAATSGLPSPSASPAASPSPSATRAPVTVTRATFAGKSTAGDGTRASVAIVIRDGRAIAYVCSGKIESWLQGTAKDGDIALTGTHQGTLTATYTDTQARGVAKVNGLEFPFVVVLVKKPSGLWRSVAKVRGAQVIAGWIVLPDGSTVGMADVGGVESEAPALNPQSPTATVNGGTITAAQVDGDTGNGF